MWPLAQALTRSARGRSWPATILAGGSCPRGILYARLGIQAVPAVIINDRHLIQGGQPTEVFEQALRQITEQERAAVVQVS